MRIYFFQKFLDIWHLMDAKPYVPHASQVGLTSYLLKSTICGLCLIIRHGFFVYKNWTWGIEINNFIVNCYFLDIKAITGIFLYLNFIFNFNS